MPIHFRADGIAIFEFDKVDEYSGGNVAPYRLDDNGHLPKEAQRQEMERYALRQKRYQYMNAMQTCFHIAANITNNLVAPSSQSHYIWAREKDGLWIFMDNGRGLIDPMPFASTIHEQSIKDALDEFRRVESIDCRMAIETLDMFYRAAFNLNHHEYQTVLILGWAIIEGCQDLIWRKFVDGGYKKINPYSNIVGARKKLLREDKNFTASIKSQILSLCGEYADYELKEIDEVRRRRNGFMHSLSPVSVDDAFAAMRGCGMVAVKALGLKLQPFGNPGGWDYLR